MEIKLHRKVQVVVIDCENREEVLLLQTKEDRNFHWQNITGSVEEGESYLDAASRELEEESGLKGEIHELDLNFKFLDRWEKNVIEKVYVALVPRSENILLCEQEHQDFKWLKINNVSRDSFGFQSNWLSFLEMREWIENNT
jgi:8-oxo-dGTP pyrophosphatase MutT (NUDIX family)